VRLFASKSVVLLWAFAFHGGSLYAGFIPSTTQLPETDSSSQVDIPQHGKQNPPLDSSPSEHPDRSGPETGTYSSVPVDQGGDGLPRNDLPSCPARRDMPGQLPSGGGAFGGSGSAGATGSAPTPVGLASGVEIPRSGLVCQLWGEIQVDFPPPVTFGLFRPPRVMS
jgi:hypothetical protein